MITVLTQIAAEALGCPVELVQGHGPGHLARAGQRADRGQPHHGDERQRDPRRGGEDPRRHGARHRGQRARLARRRSRSACSGRSAWPRTAGRCRRPTTFDLETGQGEAYICYSWSANVVEVEVDTETGETRAGRVWSGHDVGRVVNPTTGRGTGRRRRRAGPRLRAGRGARACATAASSTTSSRPTSSRPRLDTPEIQAILVEHEFPWGPYGAKGLGETPIIAVAPAVTAAIHHATGVRLVEIPATPERVWAALRARSAARG